MNPNFAGQTTDGSYGAGSGQSAQNTVGTLAPSQSITASNSSGLPPVPTTQDASSIAQGTAPIQFPNNTPNTGTAAANATSANSSIPTPGSITAQEAQPTASETTNNSLLAKLAGLIGSKQGQTTLTNAAEANAGVPALTKTVNDLNTKLQGLNDQATALANEAGQYGAIQNTERLNESGGNVLAAMQGRPQMRDQLLQNQIKQSSIASQALTVKSAVYAAQGNLTLAKDAADKSATAQFEGEQQQIDYMNALIATNKPQMDKEEKAQADTVATQLADRQDQIKVQQESFKTGQAAIADAMKNNPNDVGAQNAATQAMQLDPKDPQYLQKVQGLIGKYGSDLTARALDMQLKRAQIQNLGTQKQDSLEQQYRTALEKQFSSRSGSLGVQSQKVDQAIHLRTLLDQYKDAQGNYNVPPAQYAELAQGMASLLSGNNTLSDSRVADIQQKSAQGDLGKLMTYITGSNYSGSTNDILKNLSDSIDRQGKVSQQLRDQYVSGLKGLKPTGLDSSRADIITKDYLPSYNDALSGKYGPQQSQTQQFKAGDTQTKDGWVYQRDTSGNWKAISKAQ